MLTKDYSWRTESEKIVDKAIQNSNHLLSNIVNVTACVGSGKTRLGFSGICKYIETHKSEKTFQMFICPKIELCKQQKEDCEKYLKGKGITNFMVLEYNCESDDTEINRDPVTNGEYLTAAQHIIYIVCDKSLWDTPERIFYWRKVLLNNFKYNRRNGFIIYDEGHKYENNRNIIYGESIY